MLDQAKLLTATVAHDTPPFLLVTVDTEAEFDWDRPFSRDETRVNSIAEQYRAQDILDRYGITPTYLVDYAVATDKRAIGTLRNFLEDERCEIGSHLHPWINPPFEEPLTTYNSYPGNLRSELERKKLERLTQAVTDNFGFRPEVYRAGRYGIGPNTTRILEELNYRIDMSVVPYTSYAADGGPDFSRFDHWPFWFDRRRRLLEIPVTCGFVGVLAKRGRVLLPMLTNSVGMKIRLPGVFARLDLLERIHLTPEGESHTAHRRVTKSLLGQGCRIFSFMYHSPSLAPGNTPYVRDRSDLEAFLHAMDRYFDFFINELGGKPTTPRKLHGVLGING